MNYFGLFLAMGIFALVYWLSCKFGGVYDLDKEKTYKKETKDEKDLEIK